MKMSPKEHRARARFSRFIPTPPSVMLALRSLRNATAQSFFSFLVEKCFGFGQGFSDFSYAQLAKALGRNSRTIATVAKRLRSMGLVEAQTLANGSYRWRIPVLAEEVKEDPRGVLLVRSASTGETALEVVSDPIPIPIRYDRSIMGGHDQTIMGGMIDRSWDTPHDREAAKLDLADVCAPFEVLEKTLPKRHDQETCLKRHHHEAVLSVTETVGAEIGDDESLGHKKLFRKLLELGMKQRVARKLLRDNDHEVVSGALERVALRGDIANPAGYVLREVEDGGYEEPLSLCDSLEGSAGERKPSAKRSDAPMVSVGVEETRSQMQAIEAEREAQIALSRSQVQNLLTRFSELSSELREALRDRWTAAKEQMVPNTPRKAEILRDPKFEKMAFREVTSKFFAAVDGGGTAEAALAGL